jgi:hypothetical protein
MRVLEPVQVTGHGLGAALAMLRLLENQGANVKQLYISKVKAKDDNVLAGSKLMPGNNTVVNVGSILGSFPYELRWGVYLGRLLPLASTCRWWTSIWVCRFHFTSCRLIAS